MQTFGRTGTMSRRSAFSGLAGGGLGLATVTRGLAASAPEQQPPPASHPIVGTWLVRSADGLGLATFAADGSFTQEGPTSQSGSHGVIFTSAALGRWEGAGTRTAHYNAIQFLSDGDGTYAGTITTNGYAAVSADGRSLLDNAPQTAIITRDASDQVVSVVGGNGGAPPLVGQRVGPDAGIFQPGPPTTDPQGT